VVAEGEEAVAKQAAVVLQDKVLLVVMHKQTAQFINMQAVVAQDR
jgi:hypothetical protein